MSKNLSAHAETLHCHDVSLLLKLVSEVDWQKGLVAEWREAFLTKLVETVEGQGAFWAWGRGRPGLSAVVPVATIPVGFAPEQFTNIAQFCLSEDGQRLTQMPIFERVKESQHATVVRRELISDEMWYGNAVFRALMEPINTDDFLSSVRYFSEDSWHCVTIFKAADRPGFTPRDQALLHVSLASLGMLEPKVSEAVPAEAFVNITPRQRTVMLYLLDGMPRKQIASIMGMTLHTVNDHIKALYARFGVQSATELAARFLRSA